MQVLIGMCLADALVKNSIQTDMSASTLCKWYGLDGLETIFNLAITSVNKKKNEFNKMNVGTISFLVDLINNLFYYILYVHKEEME